MGRGPIMMKTSNAIWVSGLTAALLLTELACGGDNPAASQVQTAQGAAPVDPATAGTLTVHLVQDGLPGPFSHLNLVLAALELRVAGTWRPVPLDAPGQPVDLLAADSRRPLTLAAQVPWPAGASDAMRFTLGPGCTVQFAGDDPQTHYPLAAPGTFLRTMGLPGSFSVTAHTTTDLWIAFDVENVVQPDFAGASSYVFSPGPVRGYDLGATGSPSGTLTTQAAAGAEPLQGAAVTAQLQLQGSQPSAAIAFRTVATDAGGHYTLDLLPAVPGTRWCVVAQPVVGTASYYPQASHAATDLSFVPAAIPGSLAGTVQAAPGLSGEDTVDLVQELTVDGVPCAFVLRSAVLAPEEGGFSFSFPAVPPGTYAAVLNDYSQSPGLGLVDQARPTVRFVVAAGAQTVIVF